MSAPESGAESDVRVRVEGLGKTFRLFKEGQEPTTLPVFGEIGLDVCSGECVVLSGASGVGKSTLMRAVYGNYLPTEGRVYVMHEGEFVDIASCPPRQLLEVRRRTLGFVSQFLRVIPRIPTIQLVMEPLLENGSGEDEARERAEALLAKLALPSRLWALPPATFSGGEQQRVNIARSFAASKPVMLLDEPTASLDADNRAIVIELIRGALAEGVAMLGIFHDQAVRDAVATRLFDVEDAARAAA